ncbi:hypothetical protein [Roseibium sp.]|uniref:hypothetical protein n=1 Tax=Roseibium sp. TaxID=1936156 RepID=UPI003BAD4DDF
MGKVRMEGISIVKYVDNANSTEEDTFQFVSDLGDDREPSAASDDPIPTETISLNYEEIKVTYDDAAVLDFALTGDGDFSPNSADDFLF